LWRLSWVSRCHWFERSVSHADTGSEQVAPSGGFTVNWLGLDPSFLRNIVRSCVVLLTGIIAGGRAISAVKSLEQYQAMRMTEPSRAEPYLSAAAHDLGIVALSVTLAGLVWWLLRPSSAPRATKRN